MRNYTWLPLAALTLLLCLMAGRWWLYANQLPTPPLPTAALPSPNAYDDYVAATALLTPDVPLPGQNNRTPQTLRRPILAKNRPALARLRRGFGHAYRNPPLISFTQDTPELTSFRRLAGLLVEEGKLAEAEGRLPAAADSYLDCLRLGREVPQGGSLRHAMAGLAIHELALPPLSALAERLDAAKAQEVLTRLRRLDAPAYTFPEVLTAERDSSLALLPALLQTVTADELGKKLGYGSDLQTSATYLLLPKGQMLENYRHYMDASIRRSTGRFVSAGGLPFIPNDPLNRWLAIESDDPWACWLERDAAWRVAETRLALRVYYFRHRGRLPVGLSALAPEILPAVPEDPFVGQPLVYSLTAPEIRVYSRGPDGDDDGGRPLTWPRRDSDGDVVTMRQVR